MPLPSKIVPVQVPDPHTERRRRRPVKKGVQVYVGTVVGTRPAGGFVSSDIPLRRVRQGGWPSLYPTSGPNGFLSRPRWSSSSPTGSQTPDPPWPSPEVTRPEVLSRTRCVPAVWWDLGRRRLPHGGDAGPQEPGRDRQRCVINGAEWRALSSNYIIKIISYT